MAVEQLKFRFKGYRISQSNIRIAPVGKLDRSLNVAISEMKAGVIGSEYALELGITVSNPDKSILITVEMHGVFEFTSELTEDDKKSFFTSNAPAIMFPYLRAFITNVTAMAGIQPIVLPTMNFAESIRVPQAE